ncbi:Protein-lysine N-methyltransferase CG9154, partial [Pseudolycoriella hygida]
DEDIALPADTLAFLREFLAEKAERETREAALLNSGNSCTSKGACFSAFEEDWQLSQFWYNEETKRTLARICKELVSSSKEGYKMKIALLSCPSLYDSIRSVNEDITIRLFEFDQRFSCYGQDFVFYDYNIISDDPEYMDDYSQQFDIVLMDPPFLSEECICKLSQIVKKISKPTAKLVLCSGEVVEDWASKYLGLKKRNFRPEHERNLGNMFASYANFELDDLIR